MKKIAAFILLGFLLVGCSQEKVFYENAPEVLDFGSISNIVPEIVEDEETRSVGYVYRFNDQISEKYFKQFFDNLDKKGFKNVVDDQLNENGSISKLKQNDKYQILTVETFDTVGKEKFHINEFIISIRERYSTYSDYPTVPDYGSLNNIEASKITEDQGVKVHFYQGSTQTAEYIKILKSLDFELLEERLTYETGGMTVYGDDTYYVVVGDFPDFTMITVGEH